MLYRYYCDSENGSEICYNIKTNSNYILNTEELENVIGKKLSMESKFYDGKVIEVGPLPSFQTSWSTNALSILRDCGLDSITHIEKSRRYLKKTIRDSSNCKRKLSDELGKFDPLQEKVWKDGFEFKDLTESRKTKFNIIPKTEIRKYGEQNGLTFDDQDIEYYQNVVFKDRDPTDVELFDLAQSNSEHSRHWYFNAKLRYKDNLHFKGVKRKNNEDLKTLFELVKKPHKLQKSTDENYNSVIAFSDNASAIRGPTIDYIHSFESMGVEKKHVESVKVFPTFNAETHNFPTAIAPFPGAATGVGGRIRDTQAVGRGGMMLAGTAGYAVNNLKLLVEASNGASDYGNKIGEPIVTGFCRYFDYDKFKKSNSKFAYEKPIMFSGGIGQILCEGVLKKAEPREGMLVVRLGGPAYRIGLGGGTASSRSITADNIQSDLSAVQRGDPEMENKVNKVLMWCINQLDEGNPILSIHDQGAGGMANVTKEIVSPAGANIYLKSVTLGDKSMTPLEVWCSEYQEQITILIDDDDWEKLCAVAYFEKCPIECVGEITGDGNIKVFAETKTELICNFNLRQVLEHIPQKEFEIASEEEFPVYNTHLYNESRLSFDDSVDGENCLEYSPRGVLKNVLSNVTVGSKRFLVNKVDRSVSGLVAQQQCVGPLQTPIADCTVIANSYIGFNGIASSIGEKPILSINDPKAMVQLTIAEMLTNLAGVPITRFEDIKCSGNWMWPLKSKGIYDPIEGGKLYSAAKELSRIFCEIGIAIDGGKDSLSMVKNGIKSPGTLVLSGYVCCTDITKIVTPDFKYADSEIIYIKLGDPKKFRLGGSVFEDVHSQLFDHPVPKIDNFQNFKELWVWVQSLVNNEEIDAIHDVSDGGLITTITEMCMAGNLGCKITLTKNVDWHSFYFAEENGLVIECKSACRIISSCPDHLRSHIDILGKTTSTKKFDCSLFSKKLSTLREWWESPSRRCEYFQTNRDCVDVEYSALSSNIVTPINERESDCNLNLIETLPTELIDVIDQRIEILREIENAPKVGILREEGSNGEREMTAAFWDAGFEVYDVPMTKLVSGNRYLYRFKGIVFVGGFSYSDVFGAGQGWAQSILNNTKLKNQFDAFYQREDTFSLGVCNGCQVMSLLGWVGECKFLKNESGRFESRFSTVCVSDKSNNIFFKGMEGKELGVWCAHTEGRYTPDLETPNNLEVLEYINPFSQKDSVSKTLVSYPYNPNGSVRGVAGVCSLNGRHLAMMPHPERSFMNWQLPQYFPNSADGKSESGWYRMFKNLYEFSK